LAGWWLALGHLFLALASAITIIGLPFAWAHLKRAKASLAPGRQGHRPRAVMEWFVYVLLNDVNLAYTGIAKHVAARLDQHNAGQGAKFTRGRGPWRAVHVEGPMQHGDPLRREMVIKANSGFKRRLKETSGQSSCGAGLVAELGSAAK